MMNSCRHQILQPLPDVTLEGRNFLALSLNSTALHPTGTLMVMLPQVRAQSAIHRSAVHRCLGILQVGHHAKLVILVYCPADRPRQSR